MSVMNAWRFIIAAGNELPKPKCCPVATERIIGFASEPAARDATGKSDLRQ